MQAIALLARLVHKPAPSVVVGALGCKYKNKCSVSTSKAQPFTVVLLHLFLSPR